MAHPIQEIEHLDISADALFRFNKAGINDLLPAGKAELDALVTRLQDGYVEIEKITLVGHTDRLGSDEYNQRLSEQRAQTVRQYLQDKGIASPIGATGRGEADQVTQCGSTIKATKALVDCLQPNRRVTVEIRGFRKAPN
jgi:outer membrane protein OmpA-like peptidoglycan-associated protein